MIESIGAHSDNEKIQLYFKSSQKKYGIAESLNAIDFQLTKENLNIKNCLHLQQDLLDMGQFSLMNVESKGLSLSLSRDSKTWTKPSLIGKTKGAKTISNGVIVPQYQLDGEYLMFVGGRSLQVATSENGTKWEIEPDTEVPIQIAKHQVVQVDLAQNISSGILICYRLVHSEGSRLRHEVHMALVDQYRPTHIHWQSPVLWQDDPEWGLTTFGGAAIFRSQVYSFWNTKNFGIMLVRYPIEGIPFQLPKDRVISLEKSRFNPVIYPRGEYHWEAFATYNPAAFYAEGKIHILYRAQGHDLISSIGYASSKDGMTIDERLDSPVFHPQEVFETFQKANPSQVEQKYVSGGGIAGCEDPRVTLIDDRVFMTYVAFDGASPPRVALTSIDLKDFLAKRWLWERPVLISPPGVVDKSAVIFPEKVKGKYVIMHRIFPDILIDYVSDLNFDGSTWLKTIHRIQPRENMWDSRKIGAGAPPIKTPEGWLLIYYGVDDRDDRQYKMGAMLLDLENPEKVLYRSSTPILEPEDWYENSGFKPGIVYPCGAVQVGEKVFVYYGGADCVVCVASRNLTDFIDALKSNHELRLESKFEQQRPIRIGYYATDKKQIKPADYSRSH